MVICVKCGKEQARRSGSECEYVGISVQALKEHSWEDREKFIADLRAKLPPFIKERIAQLRKKYAEKQALYAEHLEEHKKDLVEFNKWLDMQLAREALYLKEGFPRDVEKNKQHAIRRALRSLLLEVIGCPIGIFIAFIWIIPKINPDDFEAIKLFVYLPMIALVLFFSVKPVVNFLKVRRYTESQEFADKVVQKWRDETGFDKGKSSYEDLIETEKKDIEELKDEWNKTSGSFERVIHAAERAPVGSDEEMLNFYNKDKKTRQWYVEKIYDGEW